MLEGRGSLSLTLTTLCSWPVVGWMLFTAGVSPRSRGSRVLMRVPRRLAGSPIHVRFPEGISGRVRTWQCKGHCFALQCAHSDLRHPIQLPPEAQKPHHPLKRKGDPRARLGGGQVSVKPVLVSGSKQKLFIFISNSQKSGGNSAEPLGGGSCARRPRRHHSPSTSGSCAASPASASSGRGGIQDLLGSPLHVTPQH